MQSSKKRTKIRPKSSQNHLRGRLEGPWALPRSPPGAQVGKKGRQAPIPPSLFELFSVLLPKRWRLIFEGITGRAQNRLFEDSGGQKHQKGRSKRSLFEAFSARAGFLKNVLPPARELNSPGGPDPTTTPNSVFLLKFRHGASLLPS